MSPAAGCQERVGIIKMHAYIQMPVDLSPVLLLSEFWCWASSRLGYFFHVLRCLF